MLQSTGIRRMKVAVQRQWLLQFPDGRVALFVIDRMRPDEPPLFLPVLRVLREREAWMNMRLTKRGARGGDTASAMGVGGGRYAMRYTLLAEYELARTDGRILSQDDILHEPLALHDEIGKLKRQARRERVDVNAELARIVQRLPRTYSSVGVRVYNPTTPKWKMQLLWVVMVGTCAFLVVVFFSCVAVYWEHVETVGVDNFVNAYLINTLLIQAFACEFREIVNILLANIVMRELLLLVCCLRCASTREKEELGITRAKTAGGWASRAVGAPSNAKPPFAHGAASPAAARLSSP